MVLLFSGPPGGGPVVFAPERSGGPLYAAENRVFLFNSLIFPDIFGDFCGEPLHFTLDFPCGL